MRQNSPITKRLMFSFWSKAWNVLAKKIISGDWEIITLKSLSFCGPRKTKPFTNHPPAPTSISTCQRLKLETNGRQASPADSNCLSNREAISKATKIWAMNSSCDSLCKLLAVKLKFPQRKLHWCSLLNAFLPQMQGCTLAARKLPIPHTLYTEIRPKRFTTWSYIIKRNPIIDNIIQ